MDFILQKRSIWALLLILMLSVSCSQKEEEEGDDDDDDDDDDAVTACLFEDDDSPNYCIDLSNLEADDEADLEELECSGQLEAVSSCPSTSDDTAYAGGCTVTYSNSEFPTISGNIVYYYYLNSASQEETYCGFLSGTYAAE